MTLTRTKDLVIPLIIGVLLVGSGPTGSVWADPCGMVPPFPMTMNNPELTRVGDQITYVFFSEGVQDIVLRPGFEGSVDQFGMLIPFPSPPAIRKVSDDIFNHVENAVTPPEIVVDLRARFALEMREMKRSAGRADLAYFAPGVKVLKEEAVGMYQVAVLEAENPDALKLWMTTHGYVYPTGMDDVCLEYIRDKWCFVAVKANVGSKGTAEPRPGMRDVDTKLPTGSNFEGAVQAMGFRFLVDEPVVPMRLSAFNPGELHNIVYILSDQPCRITQLDSAMVKTQIPGTVLYDNITKPLPVKVLGGTLEDAIKSGMVNDAMRNPTPKNGHAKDLFAADLLAVAERRLSHDFEEREKELLKIGERLGLRGPEVDEFIAETIAAERTLATRGVLERLKDFTLTVVEGDFPRDVIAAENLTFAAFEAPLRPGKTEQGAIDDASDVKIAGVDARALFVTALISALAAALLFGARVVKASVVALLCVGIVGIAAPAQAAGNLEDPELVALVDRLLDSERAEAASAELIARGGAALPYLIDEALEGRTVASRGWAIVCLVDIGDEKALDVLRVLSDKETGLVKMWAGAGLTRLRGVDGVRDLLQQQIKDPSQQPAVASLLLAMRGSAVRPLVTIVLTSPDMNERRFATSYLGTLNGRIGGGTVKAVFAEGLRYTPDKAKEGVPWAGGPLFLPGYVWTPTEARNTTIDLVCWLAHCEIYELGDIARQLNNNLRDLSWRNGIGLRHSGTAAEWTKALLQVDGSDHGAITNDTDRDTLLLVLQLMRQQLVLQRTPR